MTTQSTAADTVRSEAENPRHLAPAGELTIFEVSEFKDSLVRLFTNEGLVSLDLSRVTRVDTAAIQLMLAAQKQERMFVSGMSEDLQQKLKQLGFRGSLSE